MPLDFWEQCLRPVSCANMLKQCRVLGWIKAPHATSHGKDNCCRQQTWLVLLLQLRSVHNTPCFSDRHYQNNCKKAGASWEPSTAEGCLLVALLLLLLLLLLLWLKVCWQVHGVKHVGT